ncbi:MAG: hypothetical protein HKO89_00960 [Saprospiraceae bacterium]|nr:hypothetical protein [Saprospiraceae bacterium]
MLKLFHNKSNRKNVPYILNMVTFLMICAVALMIASLQKNNKKLNEEYFVAEIIPEEENLDIATIRKQIEKHAFIDDPSEYIPKEEAIRNSGTLINEDLRDELLNTGVIKDVFVFKTDNIKSKDTRQRFIKEIKSLEGIAEVYSYIPQNKAETTPVKAFNKLSILAASIILLLLLTAVSLLKSEVIAKKSEMKMLSFSGVSDNYILMKLSSSMMIAVFKAWFFSVLLFILLFYLFYNQFIQKYFQLGFQDIIVVLIIPLAIILIAMTFYIKRWAIHLLKRI